jgi:3-dehydroquinate synthase
MSENKIFISGLSGSGKSSIGRVLATQLNWSFCDLAAELAKKVGVGPAEIAARRGEPSMSAIERETVAELIARPQACVVALMSETVIERSVRRSLLRAGLLVTLHGAKEPRERRDAAGPAVESENQADRQLLSDISIDRSAAYAECHGRVDIRGKSPQSIAHEITSIIRDSPVVVPLGERSYRIYVGSGIRSRLARYINDVSPLSSPAMVITDQGVENPWGIESREHLIRSGRPVSFYSLPAGESSKQLSSVEALWNAALEGELDRSSLVLGVGGGVVGDLSGFIAATLLRGVHLGHLPTTLLAMVDSAIGGKTGFDTRQGKNLIGAFYQPRFVLSDIETLKTLPLAEVRAGLAEVVKSAWLSGEEAVAALERDAQPLIAQDGPATVRAIRMAAGLKAHIVTEDEREAGRRQLLNFGHTVGHAIEASLGFEGIRHGEAVALGMVAASRLAIALGRAHREQVERLERLLSGLGLPIAVKDYLSDKTLSFMSSDKKRRASTMRFVVPSEPGRVEVVALELAEITRLLKQSITN